MFSASDAAVAGAGQAGPARPTRGRQRGGGAASGGGEGGGQPVILPDRHSAATPAPPLPAAPVYLHGTAHSLPRSAPQRTALADATPNRGVEWGGVGGVGADRK